MDRCLWRDKWKNGLLSRCLTRIIFVRYVPATLIFRFTATVLSLSTRFLDSLAVPRLLISNVVLLYVKLRVRRRIVRIARPFFPLNSKDGPLTPNSETPCFDRTIGERQTQYSYKATLLLITNTNSNDVHPLCLKFMNLLKPTLVLTMVIALRRCLIGIVFCSHHDRRE